MLDVNAPQLIKEAAAMCGEYHHPVSGGFYTAEWKELAVNAGNVSHPFKYRTQYRKGGRRRWTPATASWAVITAEGWRTSGYTDFVSWTAKKAAERAAKRMAKYENELAFQEKLEKLVSENALAASAERGFSFMNWAHGGEKEGNVAWGIIGEGRE